MSVSASSRKLPQREGASVILLRGDRVLMVQRGRPPFAGLWSFPGGSSEHGETVEETARRELMEETGLVAGALQRLGSFKLAPDHSPFVLTVFAAESAEGNLRAGDDALVAEFVPLSEVLTRETTAGAVGWIARAAAAFLCPQGN